MIAQKATVRPGSRRPAVAVALAIVHVGALAAFAPALFSWTAVGIAALTYYLTGAIGICLGYHRLLTHRSFRLPRVLEYAVAPLGVLAMQGGPISWVATHRAHHAFSDTERDPHDSRRGFRWSHVEWLYRRNAANLSPADERRYASDLVADPVYRFLEATAFAWQLSLALVFFAFGGWPLVVWGIFVRLVGTYHVTWLVNSAAHLAGYRTYRTPGADRSTNNRWVAFLAWGEGWHNNHHAFPFSARHGLRRREVDVTWWTIALLAFVGIARDVVVPTRPMLARRALAQGD
jgi:stearoyl-CoA desaturase (delta-9 desaturase)